MAVSTTLYQLIQSMTKAEKAYFKKFSYKTVQKEEQIYFSLFDAIDRQKVYNESKLIKKFHPHKITQKFSITKNYLFKLVIKSLRAYNSQKVVDDIVIDEIRNIRILLNKGLYKEGLKRIEKAKQKAASYQLHLCHLELLKLENQAIRLHNNMPQLAQNIKRNLSRERTILATYQQELEYEQLNFKIIHLLGTVGVPKKQHDYILYQNLIENQALQNNNIPKAYRSRVIFHGLRSILLAMQEQPNLAYEEGLTLINLTEDNFELSLQYPNSYIYILNNFIINCFTLEKYQESLIYIERLKNLPKRSFLYQPLAYQALIFDITTNNELEAWILMGEFEKGIENSTVIQQGLNKYEALMEAYGIIHIHYLLAICYFALGNYKEAQSLLYYIFNHYPKATQSVVIEARILNLLVLFELKEDKLLSYYLTSTYRYLSKLKNLKTTEQLTVKHIEKAMYQPSKKAVINTFKELQDTLISSNEVNNKLDKTHRKILMHINGDWIVGYDINASGSNRF